MATECGGELSAARGGRSWTRGQPGVAGDGGAVKEIRLRGKFFAGNLKLSSSADMRNASCAVAPERDSVICGCSYSYMIKLIGYKNFS